MRSHLFIPFSLAISGSLVSSACISSGDQTTINNLFSAGGPGTIVQLCPSTTLLITNTIFFTAPNQELSTESYPSGTNRATIKIGPSTTTSVLLNGQNQEGVRIHSLIIDGDRPNNGLAVNGDASIILGGNGNNSFVSNTASRNPRSWSCLHVIGSGNDGAPCSNATVVGNDIGPCGVEGTDEEGNAQWADGISLDCTVSRVEGNTITGSTDGGIVCFGCPGSLITNNTITSSATSLGFGAINMVDPEYNSYAGTTITNNHITGQKLFNLGIGIGAYIWSHNQNSFLNGPATITGNTFSGNIAFPIAINGWQGGITVTGNDVSGIVTPRSSFADASSCDEGIRNLFNANDALVYYPPGLLGPQTLQENFIPATIQHHQFPLHNSSSSHHHNHPSKHSFPPNTQFAKLPGIIMQFQGDGNIVVLNTTTGNSPWANGATIPDGGSCDSIGVCNMTFQGDGNLVTYFEGKALWDTGTQGVGSVMECLDVEPWIRILGVGGEVVWDTGDSKLLGT